MSTTNSSGRVPLIVGIGGTTRAGSSSEKALAICMAAIRQQGALTETILGPSLNMPMYAPENPARTPAAMHLVDALRRCDGVVICSPSYHGGISGMLKNALDYTEDMRSDGRSYLADLPVGLIACGGGWQGAANALASLRAVVHSLRAWPTPFGAVLNTSSALFDGAGMCLEPATQEQIELVGTQVMAFARAKAATHAAGCSLEAVVQ